MRRRVRCVCSRLRKKVGGTWTMLWQDSFTAAANTWYQVSETAFILEPEPTPSIA